ncbi:MAG: hypothetical protein RL557_950 [archaeon]
MTEEDTYRRATNNISNGNSKEEILEPPPRRMEHLVDQHFRDLGYSVFFNTNPTVMCLDRRGYGMPIKIRFDLRTVDCFHEASSLHAHQLADAYNSLSPQEHFSVRESYPSSS